MRVLSMLFAVAVSLHFPAGTAAASSPHALTGASDLTGKVVDSALGKPLASADVIARRDGNIVARVTADQFGSWRIHDLPVGTYQVEARAIGFSPQVRSVAVTPGGREVSVDFRLVAVAVQVKEIAVSASPMAVDTRTGNQIFKENDFHGAPTQTTSQILQQSIAGAVRAPTGEVHIRGQHAEYTYYIDGLPVPPGISGSLNELFDPSVVDAITFQTGGWDAEFGKRNAAVVNVQTRVPAGPFHMQASAYAGSYNSNGGTLTLSGNRAKFGFFVSGTSQGTDLRREPIVGDTNAQGTLLGARNYSNTGKDLFAFAKVQYVATDHDLFNLDVNLSRSRFSTPFDSAFGVIDDRQQDINHFFNFSWQHRQARGRYAGSEAFAGAYIRHGSLDYTPGIGDDPTFLFYPDTATAYNIAESRRFNIYGLKADYLLRFSERLSLKAGTDLSLTRGAEAFSTTAADGSAGPSSNSGLRGNDVAGYLQAVIQPTEKVEIRTGARYDRHEYPISGSVSGVASQLSPRFRISFFPDHQNTFWLYYGRLFVPTNTEALRAITGAATGGDVGAPTVPERDHFFEAGYTHRFPGGVVTKLSLYHKRSSPGIDDTQLPGSAITTDVNIDQVRITGIEGVLEVRPGGSLSGFMNFAINHAYGTGAISGGFLNSEPPAQPFDLDHDQRISSVAGITWSAGRAVVTATGIYGSGLTNGLSPNAPGLPGYDPTVDATDQLKTGLFDLNKSFKVDPNFVLNLSAGTSVRAGELTIAPSVFVDNVLNQAYVLKGAFFSGASFGRPRTVSVRMSVSR